MPDLEKHEGNSNANSTRIMHSQTKEGQEGHLLGMMH